MKLCFILIAALLTGCATVSLQETERQHKLAHLHYQLGVDALSKGMQPKAFEELMESDRMVSGQPEVLDALAYAWLLRGDLEKAETFYQQALRHGAGAATQNNYANLLNKMKRYTDAEKAARESLDDPRYPNQDLAFINLGNALLGQHKTDAAIHAYQQSMLFNDDNNMARLRLAYAYDQTGKSAQAKALFTTILQKRANIRSAVEGLVNILIREHRRQEAQTILSRFSQQTLSESDHSWAIGRMEQTR